MTGQMAGDIGVLVVDDHPIYRLGLRERIKTIGGRVKLLGEAEDGASAIRLVDELKPQLILLDLLLPDLSGVEVVRIIKKKRPETQIIVLSSDDEPHDVRAVLQAGASSYLLKSTTGLELQEAIFAAMRGGSTFSPSIAKSLLDDFTRPPDATRDLTARELQVLELLVTGISNRLIGKELLIGERTVEVHVHSIFEKLEVSSRTEAVTKALQTGLIKLPT